MKKVLIQGAAGFLGNHLEHRLRAEGNFVVSVARSQPKYRKSAAHEFNFLDLTNPVDFHHHWFRHDFDEVYQLAGEVGGVGYIAAGDHDADILANSVRINLNTLDAMRKVNSRARILFASSQCVYPDVGLDPYAQERIATIPPFKEIDASFNTFPFAQEKLFSEKLYDAYARNHGFQVRIGRLGNTYGPYCTWDGDRAKAPAAICRKVAQAFDGGNIPLWGDGRQTRTFTYVDDAVEGMIRLMASDYDKPVNIASHEEVTIAELFKTICRCADKKLMWASGLVSGHARHRLGGVSHRGSDNTLCRSVLQWEPPTSLWNGIAETYKWVAEQALTKEST
jgi:GDP-D-mannose 3', 5'-epimerase